MTQMSVLLGFTATLSLQEYRRHLFSKCPYLKSTKIRKCLLLFSDVSINLVISFSRFVFCDNENKRWCVLISREWVWKSWQLVFYFSKLEFRCFNKTLWNVKIIVACKVFAVLRKKLVVFFSIFIFYFWFHILLRAKWRAIYQPAMFLLS